MKIELSEKDLDLLIKLLAKEDAEIKVEMHHSRNFDYKDFLKEREAQITAMLKQLNKDASLPSYYGDYIKAQ